MTFDAFILDTFMSDTSVFDTFSSDYHDTLKVQQNSTRLIKS